MNIPSNISSIGVRAFYNCENDKCVVNEEVTYSVVIEIEGIDVTDYSMTEIQITISELTGIEEEKLNIQFDTNDDNEIFRIIVIVDDKEKADKISASIKIVIDNELCQNSAEQL